MSQYSTTYTINLDAEIGNINNQIETVKKSLSSLMSQGKTPQLERIFKQLTGQLDQLKTKAATPIKTEAAFGSMQKNIASINTLFNSLGEELNKIQNASSKDKLELLPKDAKSDVESLTKAVKEYQQQLNNVKKAREKQSTSQSQISDISDKLEAAKTTKKNTKTRLNELQAIKNEAKNATQEVERLTKALDRQKGKKKPTKNDAKITQDLQAQLQQAQVRKNNADSQITPDLDNQINEATIAYQEASKLVGVYAAALGRANLALQQAKNEETAATKAITNLNSELGNDGVEQATNNYSKLQQAAEKLGIDISGIDTNPTEENFQRLNALVEQAANNGFAQLSESVENAKAPIDEVNKTLDKTNEKVEESTNKFREENAAAGEIEGLMSRAKAFVGIQGAAQLARRALSNAFQTVKELDAQMTEMAVVTDLNVGDYWDQLPEYTQRANELGVSIKSAYEAATLYYQQGLKTNEVQAVSNATLKMARIAGLGAEDATNKMTAA